MMKLIRIGGIEENTAIPTEICIPPLSSSDAPSSCFVGRFAVPANNALFTHTSQTVIPCLFISSTHFSISVRKDDFDAKSYIVVLRDHSRNGTFLNGKIVGKEEKQLKEGDEISLQYKGTVHILYKFTVDNENEVAIPDEMVLSSPKRSDNFTTDAFIQQLNALREENTKQDIRLQSILSEKESLSKALDVANRKCRANEKLIENFEKENAELKERVHTVTANASSIEARNIILQDNLEEAKAEIRELKSKLNSLSEDLKHKSMQLENRQSLVDKGSKAIAHEKALRQAAETENQKLNIKLKESLSQNERIVTANETLQDMISDLEASVAQSKEENRKLVKVLQDVVVADRERESWISHFKQQYSETVEKLSLLVSQRNSSQSMIETIVGDLSKYNGQTELEETAAAGGTFCSQLKIPRFVARGSKSHTSDADDQMVIDNTQVFDGEDMAASFSNSNINGNNHTSNNTSAATAAPPVGAAVSSSSSFVVPSRSSSRIRASQPNPTSSHSNTAKDESKKSLSQPTPSMAAEEEKRTKSSSRKRARVMTGLHGKPSNTKTVFADSSDDDENVEEDGSNNNNNNNDNNNNNPHFEDMDKTGLSHMLPPVKECASENEDDSKDRTCLNISTLQKSDENINQINITNVTNASPNVSGQESLFEDGQRNDSYIITDGVLRM